MVIEQEFPAAYYGKSPTNDGTDQYRLLGRSRDFPQEALFEFEKMAKAIEWTGGGGDSRYHACYAVWPVGESGAIVARLSDSGSDLLNRPHTVRIEAAWVGKGEVADWPTSIGGLLQDIAWQGNNSDSFERPFRLSLGHFNQNLGTNVAEALKNTEMLPSILVACHKNYRATGFDLVQDPNRPNGVNREVNRNQEVRRMPSRLPASQHVPGEPKQYVWLPVILFALCLLLVASSGWQYFSRQQLQSRYNTLDSKYAEKEILLDDVIKNRGTLQLELQQTAQELAEALSKLKEIQGEQQEFTSLLESQGIKDNDDLRARLRAFDQQKRNGDRRLVDAYQWEQFKQQNERLKKGIDRHIQDQERLIESLQRLRQSAYDENPRNSDE